MFRSQKCLTRYYAFFALTFSSVIVQPEPGLLGPVPHYQPYEQFRLRLIAVLTTLARFVTDSNATICLGIHS